MARQKKTPEEKLVDLPSKVPPDVVAEVEAIALKHERARGWVVRKMIQRGLAAYRRDGLLAEPESAQIAPEDDVIVTSDGRTLRGPFTITINGKTFPMDRLSDEILHEVSKILPLKDV